MPQAPVCVSMANSQVALAMLWEANCTGLNLGVFQLTGTNRSAQGSTVRGQRDTCIITYP